MNKRIITPLIILAVCIGGCIALSVHPFYDDKSIAYDPVLVGTWGNPASDTETWTFKESDDHAYRLIVKEMGIIKPDAKTNTERIEIVTGEDPQIDGIFKAHLLKLDNKLYLDLYPEKPEPGNDYYQDHVIPGHSLLEVNLDGDSLCLTPLDADWLKKNIKENKVKIKHESRDGEIILTASTEELQQFVAKYADEAFNEPLETIRLR